MRTAVLVQQQRLDNVTSAEGQSFKRRGTDQVPKLPITKSKRKALEKQKTQTHKTLLLETSLANINVCCFKL